MSFDATCTCPRCYKVWYESATGDETFTCPQCSYQNIEPEELDTYLDMDEEDELALMEWVKRVGSKRKILIEIKIEIDQLRKRLVFLFAKANAFAFELKSKEICYDY